MFQSVSDLTLDRRNHIPLFQREIQTQKNAPTPNMFIYCRGKCKTEPDNQCWVGFIIRVTHARTHKSNTPTHAYTHTPMHTHPHTHTRAQTRTPTHTHIPGHPCTCARARTHTYTHARAHTPTYIWRIETLNSVPNKVVNNWHFDFFRAVNPKL